MVATRLNNPRNFVIKAYKANLTYEYLTEAIECIGQQKVARMFKGKSARGSLNSISAATQQNWLLTFKYHQEHPEEPDNETFQAMNIDPLEDWHEYVKLIMSPIPIETVNSWKNLSDKKLGDEAIKHGITLGVRNQKAVKTLHKRMLDMIERRTKLWNNPPQKPACEKPDYRLMNIFKLKSIAKERNIVTYKKKKAEIIALLEEPFDIHQDILDNAEYEKLTTRNLKNIAKDRGFTVYNNLKKDEIIKLFVEHDADNEEDTKENDEKEEKTTDNNTDVPTMIYNLQLKDGTDFVVPVREDGYVNATKLCKAGGKQFKHWHRNDQTKELIKAVENVVNIRTAKLLDIRRGGNAKLQGTYIHPDLAIQLAQWLSPSFALQVSRWVRELLYTGTVTLQRPVKPIMDMTELDVEAEELEIKGETDWTLHTNKPTLYVSYIGDGLVKVGITSDITNRENKHTSCESIYKQFRRLKLFEVSSKVIEKTIHSLLSRYRVKFNKQVINHHQR
jgi:hypothetical protein